MAARLPDEDLAPVEGAAPPQTGISPTGFDLGQAGEALSSAATVGFRAGAIADRAKALEDQRSSAPYAEDVAGQMGNQLARAAGPYDGKAGFAVDQGAQAQSLAADATAKYNAGQLPGQSGPPSPGEQAQFSRQITEALAHHQSQAWDVENHFQQTSLEKTKQTQDESTAASIFAPVNNQLMALSQGLADYHMQHPADDISGMWRTGADAIVKGGWDTGTQNMSPEQVANLQPLYQSMATRGQLDASGKLGEHVVAFKQAALDNQTLQTVNGQIAAASTDPKLFLPMMTPGGPVDQTLRTSSLSPEQQQEVRTKGIVDFAKAQIDAGHPEVVTGLLSGTTFDRDLGGIKADLLAEAAKAGPSPAIRGATEAQVDKELPLEVASIASTGKSTWTDAHAAAIEAGVGGEQSEKWGYIQQERLQAQQQFQASGGVSITDQSVQQLQGQPLPQPGDPNYAAAMAAAQMRQRAVDDRLKDPVAYLWGNAKGSSATGKGGSPLLGAGAIPGDDFRKAYATWLTPADATGAASPQQRAAAAQYVSLITQGQANAGTIRAGAPPALFSQAQREALVKPLIDATNASERYTAMRAIQSAFNALPADAKLGDGTPISAHGMFIKELMAAKMPADLAAVLADSDGSPAGANLLSAYARYEATPGLDKPLPAAQEAAIRSELQAKGAPFLASNVTGVNQQLNPARMKAWYKMTRAEIAANPGVYDTNVIGAADEVMRDVTGGYKIEGAVRMPLPLAQANYPLVAATTGDAARSMFGMMPSSQINGWDAMKRGTDLARNFAISDNGAHLTPPVDPNTSGVALNQRQAIYARQVAASSFWGNVGDGRVALMMHDGTDVRIVRDDKGRQFVQSFEGAIHAGRTQHGWWQDPPPAQRSLQTPGGRPVNPPSVPVAGAAAAGAVAAHGQQAMPADAPPPFLAAPGGPKPTAVDEKIQDTLGSGEGVAPGAVPPPPNAPAAGAPADADRAPAAPAGGGAPSAGDYGQDASATVPATPIAQNALQRLLASVGAGPAVTRIFAGAEFADPEAGPGAALAPAPGHPAPVEPFPPLNVSQQQAVRILGPAVIDKESRGISGRISPKGAVGLMQLMPDTVKQWAPRLGLPVDMERARTDDAYNVAIGTALLSHLTQHFMSGANPAAGIALALAAYNAGPGRLEGYKDSTGYHQGWLTSIGDPRSGNLDPNEWVARIPIKETREYVQAVLGMTTRRLAAVSGAGPVVKAPG
jgi:hypothetical protein